MSKTASTPATNVMPDILAMDWFAPAIHADGSVRQCLLAVLNDLQLRAQLIEALQGALAGPRSHQEVDALTSLRRQIQEFDSTLKFRLGMLRPEREAAWFRPLLSDKQGPFRAAVLQDPVFAPYDKSNVEALKGELERNWAEKTLDFKFFKTGDPCLWRHLLHLNANLEQIVRLNVNVNMHLRLDVLPDDLPGLLESRLLRAFLVNVKTEVLNCREGLKACFDQLVQACGPLWEAQMQSFKLNREQRRGRSAAEDIRTQFRERRQAAKRYVPRSFAEKRALEFMGFEEVPALAALKKRYLQLAKEMHPDCQGGNEESFKRLNKSYSELCDRLSRIATE